MAKRVFILQGVSGSGKSSLAKKLCGEQKNICSADDFFVGSDGVYRFNPAHLPDAHSSCLRKYVSSLMLCFAHSEAVIVVDNTNTTVGEIAPYYALAQAYGYTPIIITVECDVSEAAERNAHGVSLSTCEAMDARIKATNATLPPWWTRISSDDAASSLLKN